jgi:exopolysaccharide production protein ExoQ
MSASNEIRSAAILKAANLDASSSSILSLAIGFFFSFRLFSVLLAVHVLHADPQIGVMLSLGLNFLLLIVVVFASMGPATESLSSILRLPCFFWILFFLGFSGLSLLWSVAASLAAAAAFWCAMVADLAMVILLLRAGPVPEVSAGIMKGYVYGACCIALMAWIMPAQSDLRLGDDEFLGPNQIGYACAFAIFLAQYLMRTIRGPWKLCAAFLAITLLRSLSKTTIVAVLVSEAFLLTQDRSIRRRTKILVALAALVVVLVFWNLLSSYYDVYTNAGNQAESLTGRLGIWAMILNEAVQHPWIGHGFHSVWKVIPPFGPDQFEARHAHNEFLQQFYAYGVVGVVMLIGLYASFLRRIRKMPHSAIRTLFLSLLLFAVIRGIADTESFDLSLPLWAIALIVALVDRQDAAALEMPSAYGVDHSQSGQQLSPTSGHGC